MIARDQCCIRHDEGLADFPNSPLTLCHLGPDRRTLDGIINPLLGHRLLSL